MSEPTPRQVLYAIVAGGFVVVTGVLTIGAAVSEIVPTWWSISLCVAIGIGGIYVALRWRRTVVSLSIAIGLFITWMIGTLILAT